MRRAHAPRYASYPRDTRTVTAMHRSAVAIARVADAVRMERRRVFTLSVFRG